MLGHPLELHALLVESMVGVINVTICVPNIGHQFEWRYFGKVGTFVFERFDVFLVDGFEDEIL